MSHVPPDDAGNSPARRRPVREFGAHLVHMPRWHKGVLLVALALAVVGLIGQARTGHPSDDSANVSSAPGGSRGFVSSDADQNPSPAAAPTVSNKLSRYAAHVGLLFLLGFILGYAFFYIAPAARQLYSSFTTFYAGVHGQHFIVAKIFSNIFSIFAQEIAVKGA